MITELVINEKLSSLIKDMLAKGFRQPEAQYCIKADEQSYVYVSWKDAVEKRSYGLSTCEIFHSDNFSDALMKAYTWLDKQPTPEQRHFREFAEILAKAVEVGKQNGIDAVLVNPLEKAMRDLSKNALMAPAHSSTEAA